MHGMAEAWFESTVRVDVNGGLNSREMVLERDPELGRVLEVSFGNGPWR
jgi:hypothetical protein